MLHVGQLIGSGFLYVNENALGAVTYSINLWRQGETVGGNGVLSANPAGMAKASMHGSAELEIEDGGRVRICVHEANKARGLFTVSGAIAVEGGRN